MPQLVFVLRTSIVRKLSTMLYCSDRHLVSGCGLGYGEIFGGVSGVRILPQRQRLKSVIRRALLSSRCKLLICATAPSDIMCGWTIEV